MLKEKRPQGHTFLVAEKTMPTNLPQDLKIHDSSTENSLPLIEDSLPDIEEIFGIAHSPVNGK